jgi:hypothetical protein
MSWSTTIGNLPILAGITLAIGGGAGLVARGARDCWEGKGARGLTEIALGTLAGLGGVWAAYAQLGSGSDKQVCYTEFEACQSQIESPNLVHNLYNKCLNWKPSSTEALLEGCRRAVAHGIDTLSSAQKCCEVLTTGGHYCEVSPNGCARFTTAETNHSFPALDLDKHVNVISAGHDDTSTCYVNLTRKGFWYLMSKGAELFEKHLFTFPIDDITCGSGLLNTRPSYEYGSDRRFYPQEWEHSD